MTTGNRLLDGALSHFSFTSGKLTRKGYLLRTGIVFLLGFLVMMSTILPTLMTLIDSLGAINGGGYIEPISVTTLIPGHVYAVMGILTIITLAYTTQRLRDMGWSAWWCLSILIPYIGLIAQIVICATPSVASQGTTRTDEQIQKKSPMMKVHKNF